MENPVSMPLLTWCRKHLSAEPGSSISVTELIRHTALEDNKKLRSDLSHFIKYLLPSVTIKSHRIEKKRPRRLNFFHGMQFVAEPWKLEPEPGDERPSWPLDTKALMSLIQLNKTQLSRSEFISLDAEDNGLVVTFSSEGRGVKSLRITHNEVAVNIPVSESRSLPANISSLGIPSINNAKDMLNALLTIAHCIVCPSRSSRTCETVRSDEPRSVRTPCRKCSKLISERKNINLKRAQQVAVQEEVNKLYAVSENFGNYVTAQVEHVDKPKNARLDEKIMEFSLEQYAQNPAGYEEKRENGQFGRLPCVQTLRKYKKTISGCTGVEESYLDKIGKQAKKRKVPDRAKIGGNCADKPMIQKDGNDEDGLLELLKKHCPDDQLGEKEEAEIIFSNEDSISEMNKVYAVPLVLIDLSGTVYTGLDSLIPGVCSALSRLTEASIPYRFVTNTTKVSKNSLINNLEKLNVPANEDNVFTSLTAARRFVEKKKLRPMLFLEEEAKTDFAGIDQTDPNAVVIGLAPSMFKYDQLTTAFNLLKNGAEFIAINKSRYFQKDGGLTLGPGAFVSALEFSSDCTAEVIGKPEPSFFLSSIEGYDTQPFDCFMIGDDVRDDIGGAQKVGMKGILVKTGKYREGDEEKITPSPYLVTEDLSDAVDHIISLLEL